VLSILFSFGRGLVFFAPGVVLWLSSSTRAALKQWRALIGSMLVFLAGLVLVYAKWWAWFGGLSWGPRFFVFAAVPASVLLAVRIRHAGEWLAGDALALLLLALSGWVGLSGAVADLSALDFCTQNDFANEPYCWYSPEYSSLWHPLVSFPTLTAKTVLLAAYCAVVFGYLAAPLVVALLRALRPTRTWAAGWRL
jgi:hypothetical protein